MLYSEISGKTLVLSVIDHDRFSRHDAIGEVQIPLNAVDLGKVVREIKELIPSPSDRDIVCLRKTFCIFLIDIFCLTGESIW